MLAANKLLRTRARPSTGEFGQEPTDHDWTFIDEPTARAFLRALLARSGHLARADNELLCLFLRRPRARRLGTYFERKPPRIYLYHWTVSTLTHELAHWVAGHTAGHNAFYQFTLTELRGHAASILKEITSHA